MRDIARSSGSTGTARKEEPLGEGLAAGPFRGLERKAWTDYAALVALDTDARRGPVTFCGRDG